MTSPWGAERPGMGLAFDVCRPGGRRKGAPDVMNTSCLLPGLRTCGALFFSPYHRSSMTVRVAR